jgi:predicted Co/Zn/Cd cation transporter (cation efflux family)
MAVTKDKLASLLFFALIAALAAVLLPGLGVPAFGVFVALVVSIFGLMLIWFAEPLSETSCFSRGVAHSSPPLLIEAIGWLMMIGYPLLLIWVIRTAPNWVH